MDESNCFGAKWLRRKAARPAEIMDAALALFAEKGFAATKMEDIALRAGVTKGTPYRYFPNKDAIFQAIVETSLLPSVDAIQQSNALPAGTPVVPVLVALHTQWQVDVIDTPRSAVMKVMLAESGNFAELAAYYREKVITPTHHALAQLITRGINQGELRPMDVDYAVQVLIAPMLMAVTWKHSPKAVCLPEHMVNFDIQRLFAAALDMLKHGLLSPTAAPATTPPPSMHDQTE